MTLYFINKVKFKNSELDIYDTGRAWHAKNHKHLIQKLESFTKKSLCFIEYQVSIKNPISCIDTL